MHAAQPCRSRVHHVFLALVVFAAAVCARAEEPLAGTEDVRGRYQEVQVADPFLELHTGPGRGYPIFYIAERGERVQILQRHTDWFLVSIERGKEGWVDRAQMERTLTDAGAQKTFRDVLFDDYLRRRLEVGFSAGRFEGDPILTAFVGYRLHEQFLLELALAQSAGSFSTTTLIYGSLVSQPFPDSRWSPYFALGLGQFRNEPKATLVDAVDTTADLANAALGVRYYVSRQFFLRGEYRQHVALISTDRTEAYSEMSLGVAFFF